MTFKTYDWYESEIIGVFLFLLQFRPHFYSFIHLRVSTMIKIMLSNQCIPECSHGKLERHEEEKKDKEIMLNESCH